MEYIYDSAGKVIGHLHRSGSVIRRTRTDVYDANGQYVGWVDDEGTFDETGCMVSSSKMPGLLLKRSQ